MRLVPIGRVRSPFRSKFGAPRQAGLVHHEAQIVLHRDISPEALRGLEGVSHIWVLWGFHLSGRRSNQATVRPPRLGGNRRIGVFASRSPFRPNPIGLSAVRLVKHHERTLHIEGGDFVDGTPVFDLKPYLPYADAINDATVPWATTRPATIPVAFDPDPARWLADRDPDGHWHKLIEQALALDPAPAYLERGSSRRHGFRLGDLDIGFVREAGGIRVTRIEDAEPASA